MPLTRRAGLYTFARLVSHPGQPFPQAAAFRSRLLGLQQEPNRRATHFVPPTPSVPPRLASSLTLSRFRTSPRYGGRPAATDMAFSVGAYAQGWSEADIAAALSHEYLSRDTHPQRQAAYIRRTLAKALYWAA